MNSFVRVVNFTMMYLLSHVYVTLPWKSTSCAERDASDTSRGTPQLCEHTERTSTGTKSASAPHFKSKETNLQTNIPIFAGSTENSAKRFSLVITFLTPLLGMTELIPMLEFDMADPIRGTRPSRRTTFGWVQPCSRGLGEVTMLPVHLL